MTEYNFAAQYQQDPQPPAGLIVKREWLKFYRENDKPERFEQIVQSWDTASKITELSSYSVCTTWGVKEGKMYLLNVYRRRMEFPELKRMVKELAALWKATNVLIEDKSSGTQLIQQLRADGFSKVEAAPADKDDKVMRLRAQTAKIEGGFVLFPEQGALARRLSLRAYDVSQRQARRSGGLDRPGARLAHGTGKQAGDATLLADQDEL